MSTRITTSGVILLTCNQKIEGASYTTPGDQKRKFLDKLLRPGNLYFYGRTFSVINHFAKICDRGDYTFEGLVEHARLVLDGVEDCGGKVEITNLDKLSSGPKVYVGNHISSLETVTLPYIMQGGGPLIFVVKESLMTYPVFGHIMKGMNCIPMTRSNPIQDLKLLLRQGGEMLKNGTSIVIFPQKTRGPEFIPEEFNSIACKLARRAGVPIQPLALETSFWGKGKKISDYGPIDRDATVRYTFGDAMDVDAKNEKEVHQKCVDFIDQTLKDWRS